MPLDRDKLPGSFNSRSRSTHPWWHLPLCKSPPPPPTPHPSLSQRNGHRAAGPAFTPSPSFPPSLPPSLPLYLGITSMPTTSTSSSRKGTCLSPRPGCSSTQIAHAKPVSAVKQVPAGLEAHTLEASSSIAYARHALSRAKGISTDVWIHSNISIASYVTVGPNACERLYQYQLHDP